MKRFLWISAAVVVAVTVAAGLLASDLPDALEAALERVGIATDRTPGTARETGTTFSQIVAGVVGAGLVFGVAYCIGRYLRRRHASGE